MWENIYRGLRDYFKRKKQHPALSTEPMRSPSSSSSLKIDSEVTPPNSSAASPEPREGEPTDRDPWPEWVHSYLQYRFNLYDRTGEYLDTSEEA